MLSSRTAWAVTVLLGCGTQDPNAGAGEAGAGQDAGLDAAVDGGRDASCEPSPIAPERPELFQAVLEHLLSEETHDEGNWEGDYGDATAYAPPVLTALGQRECRPVLEEAAAATLEWESALVSNFAREMSSEGLVGGFSLVETYALTRDPVLATQAETIVEYASGLIDLLGFLPQETVEAGGFPYGQTATTGVLVALELRYVEQVAPRDTNRLDAALRHVALIDDAAWSEELGAYRFNEGDETLHVYPNSAMMAVLALAGRLSSNEAYLDRAERLFDAVAPLYRPDAGGWHDSYQGSGDDYISLSTETYFAIGLYLLHRERPDPRYQEAIVQLLTFIETRLFSEEEGIVFHHWEYGARADWYCTGCNFQLLYFLLLQEGIFG